MINLEVTPVFFFSSLSPIVIEMLVIEIKISISIGAAFLSNISSALNNKEKSYEKS